MEDFVDYLDRWMQDQGIMMHYTTLERIADGAEEFYEGNKRSFREWMLDPRGPNNKPLAT